MKQKDLHKEIATVAQLCVVLETDDKMAAKFAREYVDLALASSIYEMQATFGIPVEITEEVVLNVFGVTVSSKALARAKEVHAARSRGKYKPRRLEKGDE